MRLSEQLFQLCDSGGNREFFIHYDGIQRFTSPWILGEQAKQLEDQVKRLLAERMPYQSE